MESIFSNDIDFTAQQIFGHQLTNQQETNGCDSTRHQQENPHRCLKKLPPALQNRKLARDRLMFSSNLKYIFPFFDDCLHQNLRSGTLTNFISTLVCSILCVLCASVVITLPC